MGDAHLMLVITERGKAEKFIRLFTEHHVYAVNCLLGEGTATSEILDYLSLEDSEKTLLLAIVTGHTLKPLFHDFTEKLFIDIPGNGIVATVPVSSVGGMRSLKYLTEGQLFRMEEGKKMSLNTEYELIFSNCRMRLYRAGHGCSARRQSNGGTVYAPKAWGAEYGQEISRLYDF